MEILRKINEDLNCKYKRRFYIYELYFYLEKLEIKNRIFTLNKIIEDREKLFNRMNIFIKLIIFSIILTFIYIISMYVILKIPLSLNAFISYVFSFITICIGINIMRKEILIVNIRIKIYKSFRKNVVLNKYNLDNIISELQELLQ